MSKNYQVKTTYLDGVTTYDIIEGIPGEPADVTFNLHLMSSNNTAETTRMVEMFEMDEHKSVASFTFQP